MEDPTQQDQASPEVQAVAPFYTLVAAPPTQTAPSASAVISMVPARPKRVPWETR